MSHQNPYSAPPSSDAQNSDAQNSDAQNSDVPRNGTRDSGMLGSAVANQLAPGRIGFYLLVAGGGAAADLWTKQAVFRWRGLPNQSPPWWLVEDLIGVETAVNIGAVFGMGAGKGTLFAALSVVAGIGILIWLFAFGAARSWWMLTSLAMVSGGIIGNLYDRLGLWWQPGMPPEWKSGVRDWILMQAGNAYKWPNYNIADSLLVVGASMLVWRSFFPELEDGSPEAENGEEKNSPAPGSH